MEFLDQVLAMLGSIAGVLGVIVSYLQYKSNRERPVPAPTPTQTSHTMAMAPTGPPSSVRIACFWVVADAFVAVGIWLLLLLEIVDNRYGFGFTVPPVPDSVLLLGPLVLTAVIGAVKVPGAIHRSGGLRRGEAQMRGKLLGSAAADLFVGAVLVIVALSLDGAVPVPEPVFGVLSLYIGYRIVSGLVDIALLTHHDTRVWVETARQPTGRVR